MKGNANIQAGFTLIELSIVLVIIGLLVGGILVGQDLISAARVRAQISQIEKYNTAVNTFRTKYNTLPGDMIPSTAAALGFYARSGVTGDGDGDGYISSIWLLWVGDPMNGSVMLGGEDVLFWTDLSAAGLIEGGFNDNSDAGVNGNTDTQYAAEMPRAKIGNGNFIFVNGNYFDANHNYAVGNGFQIIKPAYIGNPPGIPGSVGINAGLTPLEAYNMDQKVDDGLPLSGKVIAMLPSTFALTDNVGKEIIIGQTSYCVTGAAPYTYNRNTAGQSTVANCSLRFQAQW